MMKNLGAKYFFISVFLVFIVIPSSWYWRARESSRRIERLKFRAEEGAPTAKDLIGTTDKYARQYVDSKKKPPEKIVSSHDDADVLQDERESVPFEFEQLPAQAVSENLVSSLAFETNPAPPTTVNVKPIVRSYGPFQVYLRTDDLLLRFSIFKEWERNDEFWWTVAANLQAVVGPEELECAQNVCRFVGHGGPITSVKAPDGKLNYNLFLFILKEGQSCNLDVHSKLFLSENELSTEGCAIGQLVSMFPFGRKKTKNKFTPVRVPRIYVTRQQ